MKRKTGHFEVSRYIIEVSCHFFPSEPAQGPNEYCPRMNGYYAHPDPTNCRVFYSCVEGVAEEHVCPVGLHFDEVTGGCDWEASLGRQGCKASKNEKEVNVSAEPFFTSLSPAIAEQADDESGFECPGNAGLDAFGVSDPHPKFEDPADCAKFYICMNGVSARAQGCEQGLVFNTATKECDAAENVPEW